MFKPDQLELLRRAAFENEDTILYASIRLYQNALAQDVLTPELFSKWAFDTMMTYSVQARVQRDALVRAAMHTPPQPVMLSPKQVAAVQHAVQQSKCKLCEKLRAMIKGQW